MRTDPAARSVSLCVAVLVLAAWGSLAAQVAPDLRFAELCKSHLPDGSGAKAVLVDVDGDGDLDLVHAAYGQNLLHLNDGGVYTDGTAVRMPVDADPTTSVAVGDVDGDGHQDLVLGNWGQQNRLYLNSGGGYFVDVTAGRMPIDGDSTRALALVDVDGDGDLDLVCANGGQQNRLYLNDGLGTFHDQTAARLPVDADNTTSLTFCDVDGDLDHDLVFGNLGEQSRLYVNDGGGHFSDVTSVRMPLGSYATLDVAAGDVDGDGDVDVVFGESYAERLLLNDGSGAFAEAPAGQLPFTSWTTNAVALGDVDGDGDLDLVCGNGLFSGEQDRLYLNSGSGVFVDATTWLPAVEDGTRWVALGDVDADGDLDLVKPGRLYLNVGGGFVDTHQLQMPRDHDRTQAVAFGDVDGDGDLDIVAVHWGQDRLYLNDGTGRFSDATAGRMPSHFGQSTSVALGDVDGDTDLDLVIGVPGFPGAQNRLYLNDGTGHFTDATGGRLPALADNTTSLVLGDVDGDMDLDLVVGNRGYPGAQNRLYLNDGGGTFTDVTVSRMPVLLDATRAVVLGDLDGDTDLDLIVGNDGQNRLLENVGGTFVDVTPMRMPVDVDTTSSVALGDVDGDGDLDIAFGNDDAYPGQQNRLLRNTAGAFTDVTALQMPLVLDQTAAVAFADIDGDGDLDLVCGNLWGGQDRLYRNEGLGVFVDVSATRLPAGTTSATSIALGDVDGDGDLDMLIGNTVGSSQGPGGMQAPPDRLYVNLTRQLVTPHLLRVGQPYRLDAYVRHDHPSLFDVAVPCLSTTRVHMPVAPFGVLGIEPMAYQSPVLIPPSVGHAQVVWSVPNVPALAGVEVFAQAIVVSWPFEARFTNVTADFCVP